VADHKCVSVLLLPPHRSKSCISSPNTVQIILSTAHPAKFSEAVTTALRMSPTFNFKRDVLPPEFVGLLEKKKRVIDVERPDVGLVKSVIEDVLKESKDECDGRPTVGV
jgi:threonine synthase